MRPGTWLLALSAAAAAPPQVADPIALQLEVSPRLKFGDPMQLAVSVRNTSGSPVSTVVLDDAVLNWHIEVELAPGEEPMVSKRQTGGTTQMRKSGGLHLFVDRPAYQVELQPGESLIAKFQGADLVGAFMHPGPYRISVTYQDKLTASVSSQVLFDPETDMSKLIQLLQSENRMTRIVAHGYIRYLTSDQVLKNFSGETRRDYLAAVKAVEAWWRRNRSSVTFQRGKLVKRNQ